MSVAGIVLAAGAATRMRGIDKLTEPVRSRALLRDRIEMLLGTELSTVTVVLPSDRPARLAALEGLDVTHVINADAATGMASSIKAGIRAVASDAQAALIMPADMPDLTGDDIDRMLARFAQEPGMIHRATAQDGTPGSPVIFPSLFFPALRALNGDESGRAVMKAHADAMRLHALPDTHATCDLDTPEAWAAWRASSLIE